MVRGPIEVNIENNQILEINKTIEEELKIFFMCVKNIPGRKGFQEKYVGIVAYQHEQAIKRAIQFYGANPINGIGIYSHGDFETIENIFRNINTQKIKEEIIEQHTPKKSQEDIKKMSLQNFKASLIMTSEELIKNPVEKKILKEIIERIAV